MDIYSDYSEFLTDLTEWGSHVLEQGTQNHPFQALRAFLKKAARSADHDIFSPFLYLVLSARLEQEDTLLLAAALSAGLSGRALNLAEWIPFCHGEEDFPVTETYLHSSRLLYERNWDEGGTDFQLQIVPRLFLFLCGNMPDMETVPGMEWYHLAEEPLPDLCTGNKIYPQMEHCLQNIPGRKLVYLKGRKGSGRKLNYAHLAARFQMSLAVISYEMLRNQEQLRKIRLECLLHHGMYVIELPEDEEDLTPLWHWLGDEETIFLLGSHKELTDTGFLRRQYLPFSIHTKDVLGDKSLFENLSRAYPWEHEEERKDFLGRYNFLPGRMREILELARAYSLSDGKSSITAPHLRTAILRVSSHSLDKYAKKIRGVYRMEDLILPEMQKTRLLHIISRVRNRKLVYEEWGFLEKSAYGNGISMIFAGPPGTGKTMAAQVMALELGMELYRVELPSVVDKYIGETEKKLNRIFEEAEKSMAVLFFDEADVLFSKRTEIKESNDKYNNMEIAFLLQKMEEYEGISILATNYLQNFDSAFRRRISDIIDFPLPDTDLRKKMWKTMIPAKLPVSEEIDFDFLAEQFELSGSMIKNSLIYASFLAAETREPLLTMERILRGIGHELEKSGRKLGRDDYGEYGHLF